MRYIDALIIKMEQFDKFPVYDDTIDDQSLYDRVYLMPDKFIKLKKKHVIERNKKDFGRNIMWQRNYIVTYRLWVS